MCILILFFSAQDVTGYPTLKFFKSLETSEKHRGGRDLDSLVAFIDEQMGRAPAKKEVSPFRVNAVLWFLSVYPIYYISYHISLVTSV